jgi:hypothetical protein
MCVRYKSKFLRHLHWSVFVSASFNELSFFFFCSGNRKKILKYSHIIILSALSGLRLVGLSISSLKLMDQFTPNILRRIGSYAKSFHTYEINIIYCDFRNRIQLNIKKMKIHFCPYGYSMGAGMAQSLYLLVTYWRPKSRSSRPSWVKNILFSTSSRPALGPTQSPIEWIPGPL